MTIALTYKLKRNCGPIRPFCIYCENSFKKTGCLSVCTDGPTHLCLKPKVPSCDACPSPVLVSVEDFFVSSLSIPDSWNTDQTLPPYSECSWIFNFPEVVDDTGATSFMIDGIQCPDIINYETIASGQMVLIYTASGTGPAIWRLTFGYSYTTYARSNSASTGAPCEIRSGDVLRTFISQYQASKAAIDGDCDIGFEMTLCSTSDGVCLPTVTVRFLPISGN